MKKIFLKAFLDTIIVALLLMIVSVGYVNVKAYQNTPNIPFIGRYSIFNVLSNSMTPGINAGDMIVIRKTPVYFIKPGDIITFSVRNKQGDRVLVTHRIINTGVEDGKTYFETQGDANSVKDDIKVEEGNVVGKVILSIPWMGYISHLVRKPVWFMLLIVLPTTLLIGLEIRDFVKEREKIKSITGNSLIQEMSEKQ